MKNINEVMNSGMIDYAIASVSETQLMDVYEYKKKEANDKPEYER